MTGNESRLIHGAIDGGSGRQAETAEREDEAKMIHGAIGGAEGENGPGLESGGRGGYTSPALHMDTPLHTETPLRTDAPLDTDSR